MSPETARPTDSREVTAGMRAWFAYALVGAGAALLLAALVGLLPSGRGPYSLYAAGRFSSFINVATIGFPVAAVYLATHSRPLLRGARLVTLIALVELAVAAVCGTLFGTMIGLYGLVSYGPGAAAGLQAMLTWLAYLGLLAVAVVYGLRVWRVLFATRRARDRGPSVPAPTGAAADRTTFLRAGTVPHGAPPEQTSFLRVDTPGRPPTPPADAASHAGDPPAPGGAAPADHAAPAGSSAAPGGVGAVGTSPPAAAEAPTVVGGSPAASVDTPPTVFLPASASPYQAGPPTVVPAPPTARPPRAAPRSGAVYGTPPRTPSPDVAAALAGQEPDKTVPPPPPIDATQVLSGPEGTQILPKAARPGPETTHLLPPHER